MQRLEVVIGQLWSHLCGRYNSLRNAADSAARPETLVF
eukprot:COSAG02_NODE_54973_length_293_cov_0.778351_1_plen_37_part_01